MASCSPSQNLTGHSFLSYPDINECLNPRQCAHIPSTYCVNTYGGHRCTCMEGFTRTATGCESKLISFSTQSIQKNRPDKNNENI